jgi:hypothetical protein
MPVDVFHFNSKHKSTDDYCNERCNPIRWPELRTLDGKWVFNSSAAEQANVWFGGFQAMVRNMHATRYNFFLDEMILRRNRVVVKRLYEAKQVPYLIHPYELGLKSM